MRTKKRLRLLTALALWAVAFSFLCLSYFIYDLPGTDDIKPVARHTSITILANDGSVLARYGGLEGYMITVADLPVYVPAAVLAIEDRRFYDHFGIDIRGLARAMWTNVQKRRFAQGGSTITQQLAKNLFLTADKTLRRKVQEALLALMIEFKFSKDDILSAYLNRVYFGAGAYGIDAASRTYFDKPATDLTLWEGAVIAGLLKAPTRFSPSSNPELAKQRAKVVIAAMQDAGYITPDQQKQEIRTAQVKKPAGSGAADVRYFTDWVINQIDSFVASSDRDLIVRTTLDPRLQKSAEKNLQQVFSETTAEDKVGQAALVTLQNDGAILAMLGGRDYNRSQFNRAVSANRQPGSSFKPFVYLAALEKGFTPNDVIEDAPITTGSYRPKNYDDKYHGTVTLTDALAFSLNTVAVRLLSNVGISALMDVTRRLGFTTPFKPELATGLGASEASVLEMTNAYAVIASGGRALWPYAVLSVEDSAGNLLFEYQPTEPTRLFAASDIAALDSMLQVVVLRGTGQAAAIPGYVVAGKTGTSQNYRDAWFVGYSGGLVTGIWMGNDDNTPMNRVTGGLLPASLFGRYMAQVVDLDIPQFASRNAALDNAGGFMSLLSRWSSGEAVEQHQPRFEKPAYNR